MENMPCPQCGRLFSTVDDLVNHAKEFHGKLTRADFAQVDSHWIYVVGAFHMSITPNKEGQFSLHVYGSVEPIPSATQYPSEPEWDRALQLANKFMDAYRVASRDE